MRILWFDIALICQLLATAGFIVFLARPRPRVHILANAFLMAGFAAHSLFLGLSYHALRTAPVLDLKSALAFFAWSIIGVYLLLQIRLRLKVLGSFVAPFATFLMVIAAALPAKGTEVHAIFRSLWLTAHVVIIFVGDALFAIMFLVSIMYLIQENQIKHKRLGSCFKRLPSLAVLDAVNHQALLFGFAFLTVGMILGSIYAHYALGTYWQWDPKEVWSLITWICYAILLHERLALGWQGRKAALLAIVCFGVMLFTFLGTSLLLGGYHSFESFRRPGLI